MEETIRSLNKILTSLKNQHGIEFAKPVRAGNQASMAINIIRDINAELIRLEEECERCEQWREKAGLQVNKFTNEKE